MKRVPDLFPPNRFLYQILLAAVVLLLGAHFSWAQIWQCPLTCVGEVGAYPNTNTVNVGGNTTSYFFSAPPAPPQYLAWMRLFSNSWGGAYYQCFYTWPASDTLIWNLEVNPHGNVPPLLTPRTATVSWNPDSFPNEGNFSILNNAGAYLINDMRDTSSFSVTGLGAVYFKLQWTGVPDPPVLVSPDSGAVNVSYNPTNFTWQLSQWASSYCIQVATNQNFTQPLIWDTTLTITSANHVLPANNQYWWRVCAMNATDTSEFSTPWSFTTALPPILEVNPDSLSFFWESGQPAPQLDTITIANIGAGSLSWTASDSLPWIVSVSPASGTLSGGDSTFVTVQVGNFPGIGIHNGTITVAAGSVQGSPQTIYVRLDCSPARPALTNPQNNATGVMWNPTTFNWTANSTVDSFRIQVSRDNLFTPDSIAWDSVTLGHPVIHWLSPTTQYWWRVYAQETGVTSPWSGIFHFTTNGTPTLWVDPDTLSFTWVTGDPPPADLSFHVRNTGIGMMYWGADENISWLEVHPDTGYGMTSNQDSLVVCSILGSQPAAGTYSGNVIITAPGAVSSPETVFVSLEVTVIYDLFSVCARLAQLDFTVSSDTVATVGDTICFAFIWGVNGSGLTPYFNLNCLVDGQLLYSERRNVNLGSQQMVQDTTFSSAWVVTTGNHQVRWLIDADNEIQETNEGNNEAMLSFSAEGSSQLVVVPDLLIYTWGDGFTPSPTQQNISISNQGYGSMSWNDSLEAISWLDITPDQGSGLGHSQSQTASCLIVGSFPGGGSRPDSFRIWAPGALSSPMWIRATLNCSPVTPGLRQPVNGAINISYDPVLFKWSSCSTATKYYIEVATNPSFSPIIVLDSTYNSPIPDTIKSIVLNPATLYYWHVKSKNLWTASAWSSTGFFTTTALNITITPVNPPIQIPALGGSFNFDATIENGGSTQQIFDVWIMVRLPNMTWYGPVLGPLNLTLPPGISITRLRTQAVPGSAPAGLYTYCGYVGLYTSVKWDSSSFPFTKLSTGDGPLIGDWENLGESFEPYLTVSEVEIPESFAFTKAYPNPFNPTTTLSFALPEPTRVKLAVYDLRGREVVVLVDGWREAGYYDAPWEAGNLASGIYFYQLQAGKYSAIGKMVLVK